MPRAPRKAKKRNRYADFAAEWDRRREHRGAGDWLIDKPELALDAVPFLQTLRRLGYVTQDGRFAELHRVVMNSDLVDHATGHWSRPGLMLSNPLTRDIWPANAPCCCKSLAERLANGWRTRESRTLNYVTNCATSGWRSRS